MPSGSQTSGVMRIVLALFSVPFITAGGFILYQSLWGSSLLFPTKTFSLVFGAVFFLSGCFVLYASAASGARPGVWWKPQKVSASSSSHGLILLTPVEATGMRGVFYAILGAIVLGTMEFGVIYWMLHAGELQGQIILGIVALLMAAGLIATLRSGVRNLILAIVSPTPILCVSTTEICLGDSVELSWSFKGRTKALQQLQIFLKGRERIEYDFKGGDDIEESIFASVPIVETAEPSKMISGVTRIEIPLNTMHSFEANNHQIRWTITLRGATTNWRPVEAEYRINILPVPPARLLG